VKRLILAFGLVSVLTGCASTSTHKSVAGFVTGSTPSTIVLSRMKDQIGSLRAFSVYDNNRYVGELPNNSVLTWKRDPGEFLLETRIRIAQIDDSKLVKKLTTSRDTRYELTFDWFNGIRVAGTQNTDIKNKSAKYSVLPEKNEQVSDKEARQAAAPIKNYVGGVVGGKAHGYGTYTYPNGTYKGQFTNGKKHGYGIYTYNDGSVLTGTYKDDFPIEGTYQNNDGSEYEGTFIIDEGKLLFKEGTFKYANGDSFVGTFKNSGPAFGSYYYANGDVYRGQLAGGIRIGQGTIVWKDGGSFVGSFLTDSPYHGTYTYPNGDLYEGYLENGKRHGIGTFTPKSGVAIRGIWDNDKLKKDLASVEDRQKDEPAPIATHEEPNKNDQLDGSRVLEASSGSAFMVSKDGHLVTNHHVVKGCRQLFVTNGRDVSEATIVASDRKNDLAILKTDIADPTALALSESDPYLLQEIIVAGYPFGKEISSSVKVTKGIISNLSGINDNYTNLQIDAAVQTGNSGGPILDEQGNVVAVTVQQLSKKYAEENFGSTPENINFGIKAVAVKNMLNANRVSGMPSVRTIKNSRQLADLINDTTYYVSCWMSVAQIRSMLEEKVMFDRVLSDEGLSR